MNHQFKKNIILLSPILIIGINHLVARIAGHFIGAWAFIPVVLIAWSMSAFFIYWGAGKESIKKWLRKSNGSFGWAIFALSIAILVLPFFLLHWELLLSWVIFVPWILIALINPWIEEFYWRGLLLDNTKKWPTWLGIVYSSFVFAINHPLAFGVNSVLNSGPTVVISTFTMGVIWAIVYKKTGSLRWAIFAHFLVDIFNLSVPAFLNMYSAGW